MPLDHDVTLGRSELLVGPLFRGRAAAPSTKRQDFRMDIKRVGTQPSGKGPAEWFTGTVRIDPLFQANSPARAVRDTAA
jgi:hypothetical protein